MLPVSLGNSSELLLKYLPDGFLLEFLFTLLTLLIKTWANNNFNIYIIDFAIMKDKTNAKTKGKEIFWW